MILFAEDWGKYPITPHVHIETPNKSAVRYSSLLKSMGVKNHAFPLALLDRDLIGVDPFDENISLELQGKITIECKLNPWYFFREILRIPPQAGGDAVPLQFNRGNIALFWLFFNHIVVFLIQIRQTGKSVSSDGLATYLLNIRCSSTEINLLTKDDTLRANNITRLKDMDSELPFYLKQRSKRDANNSEMITIKSLGNEYKAHVPQMSPKGALKVGRGLTSPIFLCDEGPFQPNIHISLPAALAAGGAARDIAKMNGEPYGTVLTTTTGEKDHAEGKFFYNLLCGAATFTEAFYDCDNLEQLENVVRKSAPSGELRVNCTFNHRQLGKTDVWLKKTIADTLGSDPLAINRDFFNVWTSGTLTHPLAPDLLQKINDSKIDDFRAEINKKTFYTVKWFYEEEDAEYLLNNRKILITCDPSDAAGGDSISFIAFNLENGDVICASEINDTNLIVFSDWLCDWLIKYDQTTLLMERRSSGVTILDYIIMKLLSLDIDPFRRIFNRIVNEKDEKREEFENINCSLGRRSQHVYTDYKRHFGFATSGGGVTSRHELYTNTLQNAAKNIGDKAKDPLLINQISRLIKKNNRVDHEAGAHDDMVIAWLLGYWFMSSARNLDFYGIDSSRVLIKEVNTQTLTSEQKYDFYKQQEYRADIEKIVQTLSIERDEHVCEILENKLKVLNSKLVLEEDETNFSIDEVIKNLKEDRRKNRINNSRYSGHINPQNYDPYLGGYINY